MISNHNGETTPLTKKRKKRFSLDNPFPKERKENHSDEGQ